MISGLINQLIFWAITLAFVGAVGSILSLCDLWGSDGSGAQMIIMLIAGFLWIIIIVVVFPTLLI
jgi:hypothetical protein